jgi:TFIIF-interacting CTD phosphatase-like protein
MRCGVLLNNEKAHTCDRYELTYQSPVYDTSGSSYAEQEAAIMDSRGQLKVA